LTRRAVHRRPARDGRNLARVTAALAAGAFLLLATSANAQGASGAKTPRNVLVLFQEPPNIPMIVELNDGLRRVLQRAEGVSVFTEHLDLSRFSGPDFQEGLRRWLLAKYASLRLDLIVAVAPGAVAFATQPEPLWPGVPVVFCAVDDSFSPEFEQLPNVTGLVHHYPIRETMELALRLLPTARAFAMLGGASAMDLQWKKPLEAAASHLPADLRMVELFGLSMEETLKRLEGLPPGTPLVGVTFLRDGAGRQWTGPEVARALEPVAPGPLFTPYDFMVGRGAAGGVVLDFFKVGEEAGRMALRVLAGDRVTAIPVQRSASARVVLDARILERWGIPARRIPPDAEVRFRTLPPWKEHPWVTVSVGAALVLQGGLILVLLVERRRRRVAEAAAGESRAAVAHMNRVGSVGELAGSLAHEINTPLASIQNSARALRRLLSARGGDVDEDVKTNLGIIEGEGQRAGEVIRRMRAVLRRDPGRTARLDAAEVAGEALALAATQARQREVDLRLETSGESMSVDGDKVQLLQVLLNLVLNGIEAVSAQASERKKVSVRIFPSVGGIRLQVADAGNGFDPAARARLFEPFFTTKESGLGMGLSISRTIVEAHGGRMWLGDDPGGAVVNVELPVAPVHGPTRLKESP